MGQVYQQNIVPLIQESATKMSKGVSSTYVGHERWRVFTHRRVHRALFLVKVLDLMKWPGQSPNLDPLEKICSLSDHQIRLDFPRNCEAVIEAAQLEWSNLTVFDALRISQSKRQRCQSVIDAQGFSSTCWTVGTNH